MANTLEGLSGQSLVTAHNSSTDLTDKTPLQAYRGASVSQLATAARVAQKGPQTVDSGEITPAFMLKRIITSTPDSASVTLTTQNASNIIATLSLADQNDSFEFSIINLHASNVVVLDDQATSVSIVGNAQVAGATSGQFRIRRTSKVGNTDAVVIYRVA